MCARKLCLVSCFFAKRCVRLAWLIKRLLCYRYVLPHRVGFLHRFGLKTGIHFAHFGLELGVVFEGTTGEYKGIYRFTSK